MKRNRPKKKIYNLTVSQRSSLRRKWRLGLKRLGPSLTHLFHKRRILLDLRDIVDKHPEVKKPGAFINWMVQNYVVAATVSVRRFTDQDRRSISLWIILYEMLKYPGIITRRSHTAMYRESSEPPNLIFDEIVGKDKDYVPENIIRADIVALEKDENRIRRFVNKEIAHTSKKGKLRNQPTFDDLDVAIRRIDAIMVKYNQLLNGPGPTTFEAIPQYNWYSVLKKPWVP